MSDSSNEEEEYESSGSGSENPSATNKATNNEVNNGKTKKKKPPRDAHKRHSHNMLERKRRDHIKEKFSSLKDAVPIIESDNPSRSVILHTATEYIKQMKQKNVLDESEVNALKALNSSLAKEVLTLEAQTK